jgi:glyoxylate/hydroxypyruvate reductase A
VSLAIAEKGIIMGRAGYCQPPRPWLTMEIIGVVGRNLSRKTSRPEGPRSSFQRSTPNNVLKGKKMALLIVAPEIKTDRWVSRFRKVDAKLDIRVWPDTGDPGEIRFAVVWKPPKGVLKRFPGLECIASLGAGVDHVLEDPDLPAGVPITRVVDPSMSQYMSEYVIMAVLNHLRLADFHRERESFGEWKPRMPMLAADNRVGIMGMGQLGGDAAAKLVTLGFPVAGWSRTPKAVEGVEAFYGAGELDRFLARSRFLVCLLPLTPETRGILCRRTFEKLPKGAYVINVARGGHLVEADLLEAIDTGHLTGACLDVFREEPLPEGHPFWAHPKITVTPHISSITNPAVIAPQIADNYQRVMAGKALRHVVNVERGY